MKWFRTLRFRKCINNGKVIMDSTLIEFLLQKSNYYDLRILNVELYDHWTSQFDFWGDRKSFMCFARDFVKKYKDYIIDIQF